MENQKETEVKKEQSKVKKVLSFLGYLLFGGLIGILLGVFYPYYGGENFYLTILSLVSGLVIGFILHIIIHEAGHLLFGLLTGYSFVSFRVGTLTLIRQENSFQVKRLHLPGTAGQCLMEPPSYEEENFPYLLYNLGGVIANITVSAFTGWILFNTTMPSVVSSGLLGFLIVGLLVAITNGIPQKIEGMPNDGYNIKSIKEDEEAKKAFYVQLKANALASKGVRYSEFPYEMVHLEKAEDFSDTLKAGRGILEYNWHLDRMDFERAGEFLKRVTPYLDKMIPVYKNELNCERLFIEIIGDQDDTFIEQIYTKDLQNYIKLMRLMPSKKRLLLAYEGLYQNNKEKALKHYVELQRKADTYPLQGEAAMERMLGDWLLEQIEKEKDSD